MAHQDNQNMNVWKRPEAGAMKKESSGAGAALMKNKSSGARAIFMKKRAPEPELCNFYDGSAALK